MYATPTATQNRSADASRSRLSTCHRTQRTRQRPRPLPRLFSQKRECIQCSTALQIQHVKTDSRDCRAGMKVASTCTTALCVRSFVERRVCLQDNTCIGAKLRIASSRPHNAFSTLITNVLLISAEDKNQKGQNLTHMYRPAEN